VQLQVRLVARRGCFRRLDWSWRWTQKWSMRKSRGQQEGEMEQQLVADGHCGENVWWSKAAC
jgi:hypothetical protein